MPKIKHVLTQEQQEHFYRMIDKYQVILNLQNWRIERHSQKPQKGNLAEVHVSYPDRSAAVLLCTDWGEKEPTPSAIAEIAVHELLHVFLRTFEAAVQSRDPETVDASEHDIVIVLQKLLTP